MNTKFTYKYTFKISSFIGAFLGLNPWYSFERKSILKPKLIIIWQIICVIIYTLGFVIKLRILTTNLFVRSVVQDILICCYLFSQGTLPIVVILMQWLRNRKIWKQYLKGLAEIDDRLPADQIHSSDYISFGKFLIIPVLIYFKGVEYKTYNPNANAVIVFLENYSYFHIMFFCKQHVTFIKWKYQQLQDSLQEVVNNIKRRQLENHISKIRDIENLYMELRRLVENFNHLFGWPILQTIVYISMNILLLLYTIIFDKSFRNIGYWYSIYIYILVDISVYLVSTKIILSGTENKTHRSSSQM